jgi:hypothetical protein
VLVSGVGFGISFGLSFGLTLSVYGSCFGWGFGFDVHCFPKAYVLFNPDLMFIFMFGFKFRVWVADECLTFMV